jgi:hypothetical protein
MTIVRLDENYSSGALQVNRTIWASVEAFASAFVANVPTLYTLRKRSHRSNHTPEGTLASRSSTRPETGEGKIRVTKSVELAEQYESPTLPGKAALYGTAGDAWDDKRSSQEEMLQNPVRNKQVL